MAVAKGVQSRDPGPKSLESVEFRLTRLYSGLSR
jgi:hypothetical protein